MVLAVAFGVNEAKVGPFVRSAVAPVGEVMLVQRLLLQGEPVDPQPWTIRLVLGSGDQRLFAERTKPLLPVRQGKTRLVQRRWRCFPAAVLSLREPARRRPGSLAPRPPAAGAS